MDRDMNFLTGQNSSFQQQITSLQSTLATINQQNDKRTTERLAEYKEIFSIKENILNSRISQLESNIETCEIEGANALKIGRSDCEGYQEMLEYISYVKKQEVEIIGNLSALHDRHYNLKSEYMLDQAECEKRGNNNNNICEIASSEKGKVEALELEIETKNKYLAQLNEQLLSFRGSLNANKRVN
ncbi:hypothetical protein HCH_03293 [Hahella chejuensis KCTC 2396]|uniref:Uncharacterized protein n=2 Tax=Hahella chejuensis TaxID=158327 RepID=Q2SH26_HAHCH|nr:hypothetical protein HCH_03293 [Hahella chejuensis KCTC 2396]